MNLLNILARKRTHHAFAFFLINAAQQNDFTARLFQKMSNVAAHRHDGDFLFLLGQGTCEQSVTAAVLDKHRFAVVHQGSGKLRQLTFQGVVVHHARFDIFAVQRHGIAMRAAQITHFFQKIEVLADSDFRHASAFSQINDAYTSCVDHHL